VSGVLDEVPTRVLALGAHTKDVDINAGALLRKWASKGTHVVVATLTDSTRASTRDVTSRAELALLREQEQRRAAGLLGYGTLHFLGFPDGSLDTSEVARRAVALLIRRERPEVVLTHDPWKAYDLMSDHRATGFVACDAVIAARDPLHFPELADAQLPVWRPRCLVFFSAEEPNESVDVTDEIETKIEALMHHGSHSVRARMVGTLDDAGRDNLRLALLEDHRMDGDQDRYVERFRVCAL
jgi:LmbE family N-acetylglucosaminyl deacetylase